VIGEDLGTVPDEVRAALARAGALSCRLLYFERNAGGGFRPPAEYPREALVALSTHDLPTLAGWWRARAQDRAPLLAALERAGRLPPGLRAEAPPLELEAALARAVHEYLALAPACLMAVQLEDVLGVTEQANVPGTTHEHPNWRRKLPLTLEAMASDARLDALGRALTAIRTPGPRAATGASPS
jgi:(1->4)-alpha-D-glucan 1-alpha-D-glucosylmutase